MADRVAPISAVSYPTDSFRELLQALDGGQQGVVNSGDLAVSQHAGSPAMNVDVAAGYVLLHGLLSSVTQGTYGFLKDAVATYTVAAADPTNPRRDLVCAVITDSIYAVDGTPNTQNIRVLTVTPNASPVDPAIPATWAAYVILARILVTANKTSILNTDITDLRTRATPKLGAAGSVGYAQVTANQTGITAEVALTGLSVTVTLPAGRRIRITGNVLAQNTNADPANLYIKEGATYLQAEVTYLNPVNTNLTMLASVVLTPGAGAHTYNLQMARSAAGTVQMSAAATSPAYILVEDIGPV